MAKRDLMTTTPAGRSGAPLAIDPDTLKAYALQIVDALPDPDRHGGRQYLLPGLALASVMMCHGSGRKGDLAGHYATMKAFHTLLEQFHGDMIKTDVASMRAADAKKGKK